MFNIPFKVDLKSVLKSIDEIVKTSARTAKQANSVFQAFATGSSASVGRFAKEASASLRHIGLDATRVASGAGKAFNQIARDGSKTFHSIARDSSRTASQIGRDFTSGVGKTFNQLGRDGSRTFSQISRDGSRTLHSLIRDSSRTASAITRDFANIAKSFANVSKLSFGSGGGGRGGILSWISPGIGIGFGTMIADGIMSAVRTPFSLMGQAMADSMELTAVNRKFDIVFDNARYEADRFARDWAEKINGSVTQTKAMMTRFQDTAVPLGFDRRKSYEMSKAMTMLTTDLVASEPGFTADDVAARLQSAIVGNHEAMRIFGVALSEVTLKQELMNMGIAGGVEKATEQEKVLARLNFILRATRDAHGAAARAQGDLRQQLGGLSAVVTETSSRFGLILAPAVAQFIALIKDCVREINKALGPSEKWGVVLADATKSILSNARGIKEYFAYVGRAIGQTVITASEGMKTIAAAWNDPKAFYGNIVSTIQSISVIIKPHLIFISQEILKVFGGIGGAIAGSMGVATNVIQEFIKTVIEEMLKLAETMEEYAANIPGTKAYNDKKKYIQASYDYQGVMTGIKNYEDSGMWTPEFAHERRQAATKKFEEETAGLNQSSTKPFRDAIAKLNASLSDKDFMTKLLTGASSGYQAGSQGIQDTGFFKGLGDLEKAKEEADNAVPKPAEVSTFDRFTSRIKTAFESIMDSVAANPDAIGKIGMPKKSKAELDADQAIKDQEKAIKKLRSGQSLVEFTTSESLWTKMQTAFADKEPALKVAEAQLGVLRKNQEELKAGREAIGKLGNTIGVELSKVLGYAE